MSRVDAAGQRACWPPAGVGALADGWWCGPTDGLSVACGLSGARAIPAYASSRAARVAWGASHRFPTKPSRLSSPSRQRRRSFGGETRALHRMMLRVRCFEHAAGEEKFWGGI